MIRWYAGVLVWLASWILVSAEVPAASDRPVELQFSDPVSPEWQALGAQWLNASVRAVTAYYGRFPVAGAIVRITPRPGHEPNHGQAFGEPGPKVTIGLGREATLADLADDWMLPHELLHLCFPSVSRRHHWMEEGLSTYVESVARARAGLLTPEHAWNDLAQGLPQGQPREGDQGLDHTATWGRTYWGGALFWFEADVEIRRATKNQRGLEDALRAIAAEGGTIEHEWEVDHVIQVGDQATGVTVLRTLYDRWKATPVTVDLSSTWRELGIVLAGRRVTFDDAAPLASVRRAIMREPSLP